MGLLSAARKLSKVSKTINSMDLPEVDAPVSTNTIVKPEKLNIEADVNFETKEALEMLSNEKSIEAWKTNNKVPKEESKRRKQRKFSKQAKDLQAGIMSGPSYRRYIKENQPATSFSEKDLATMLPNFKNVVGALTKDKSDKGILGLNNNLEKGSVVTSRLDIPAYNEYNVWVTSIVDKIKGKLYGRTAVLKNVNFDMTNEGAKQLALDIATEKKKTKKVLNKKTKERVSEEYTQTKTPFATMKGEWQDVLDQDAFALAKKYINDPDWIQVGFNPERHSFFYDKATMMPVFEAEEVVQVGALVLAKVKKLNTPELRAARIAKLRKLRITNMPEGSDPTTFNKGGSVEPINYAEGGAVPMNNQMRMFAEGGLNDEGGMIDEVSGNEVPIGGTKEGVRDDIPANVSEGEFIMPADVVRYHGLDKMMQIRQEAKMGLKKMEAMGQMGNSDEATMDDDMPFDMSDLIVVGGSGEPMSFADGGFVPSYAPGGMVELETAYVPTTVPTTDNTETTEVNYSAYMDSVTTVVKEYRNAAGETIAITFINGEPTTPIPEGYSLYTPVAGETGVASSAAGSVAAVYNSTNNNNNNDNDRDNVNNAPVVEAINYAKLSDSEFAARMELENGKGYQFGKTLGYAIASMIPFGMTLMYGANRQHTRRSEERLNRMIEGSSGAVRARYIAILNETLDNAKLKPTDKTNFVVQAIDSLLVDKGFTTDIAKSASTNSATIGEAPSVTTPAIGTPATILPSQADASRMIDINKTPTPAITTPDTILPSQADASRMIDINKTPAIGASYSDELGGPLFGGPPVIAASTVLPSGQKGGQPQAIDSGSGSFLANYIPPQYAGDGVQVASASADDAFRLGLQMDNLNLSGIDNAEFKGRSRPQTSLGAGTTTATQRAGKIDAYDAANAPSYDMFGTSYPYASTRAIADRGLASSSGSANIMTEIDRQRKTGAYGTDAAIGPISRPSQGSLGAGGGSPVVRENLIDAANAAIVADAYKPEFPGDDEFQEELRNRSLSPVVEPAPEISNTQELRENMIRSPDGGRQVFDERDPRNQGLGNVPEVAGGPYGRPVSNPRDANASGSFFPPTGTGGYDEIPLGDLKRSSYDEIPTTIDIDPRNLGGSEGYGSLGRSDPSFFDPRNLGGSEGYGSLGRKPTVIQPNPNEQEPNQEFFLPPRKYVAPSIQPARSTINPARVSTLGQVPPIEMGEIQEVINQITASDDTSEIEPFKPFVSPEDTRTVAQKIAAYENLKTKNSFRETLANLITPLDGARYINGQLVNETTGESLEGGGFATDYEGNQDYIYGVSDDSTNNTAVNIEGMTPRQANYAKADQQLKRSLPPGDLAYFGSFLPGMVLPVFGGPIGDAMLQTGISGRRSIMQNELDALESGASPIFDIDGFYVGNSSDSTGDGDDFVGSFEKTQNENFLSKLLGGLGAGSEGERAIDPYRFSAVPDSNDEIDYIISQSQASSAPAPVVAPTSENEIVPTEETIESVISEVIKPKSSGMTFRTVNSFASGGLVTPNIDRFFANLRA